MELYNIILNLDKRYERRKSQEQMFDIVKECINKEDPYDQEQNIVLIEAPTGTGKSFGYLLPIIDYQMKNPDKLSAVVSTKTKILQEQLRKDLEFLSSLKKNYFGKGINYLILKGKANYLCLDRFYDKENALKQTTIIGKVNIAKTIKDLIESQNWDGDVEFVNESATGQTSISPEVWSEINIDEHYCDSAYRKSCPYLKDCFYYQKLKTKETKADIIVVNHSLLVLKEFDFDKDVVLVIDEAHELDDALVKSLTMSVSVNSLNRLINSIKDMLPLDKKNMLDDIDVLNIFKSLFEPIFKDKHGVRNSIPLNEPFFTDKLMSIYSRLDEALKIIRKDVEKNLSERLEYKRIVSQKFKRFLEDSHILKKDFTDNLSVDTDSSTTELLDKVEQELVRYLAKFRSLANRVSNLYNTIKYMEDEENQEILGFMVSKEYSKRLEDFNYKVESFPIFPKNAINLGNYKASILTSATLDKDLIYLTTGIKGKHHSLEAVFNYESVSFVIKNTLPKQKEYWQQELLDSLKYLRTYYGKVLVLLTSYEQMECIPKDEEIIFQSRSNISLRKAIQMIEEGDKNILVGVDSVWTGIDLKGEKGLLMAKLPFEAPSEPVYYHRMRYFEKHGEDGFSYARKRAFLQFKQGFGRLMRSKNDKGTIIICDSRIWKYEEFIDFIKSLNVKIYYNKDAKKSTYNRQQRGD